jgi:hypothetical protein
VADGHRLGNGPRLQDEFGVELTGQGKGGHVEAGETLRRLWASP